MQHAAYEEKLQSACTTSTRPPSGEPRVTNVFPRRGLQVMASNKQTSVASPRRNCKEKEEWQEEEKEHSENDDKDVGWEQA